MKNATRYCAGPVFITGCAQQTFTVQNKPAAAVAPKGNHHPSFLRFWELGRRKTVDAAKICGGAENVVKTEPSKTFVNGIAWFYYFRHLYSLEACVLPANNCMSCPSIWAIPIRTQAH